ncbi:Lipin/Ned1/Smp2-domain-containing protein [Jimgerdemannia flammicorona]|uniref:phosphatidate phosphatase n=1 Tax=Jimgerdemannia flammicorona TaxID=994334 RepID=A0A433QXF6_9FUNG|nr:Lipin/Ned1/Smp2-domain-containing protein [Jimgerdemannia flammicorona]
MSVLLDWISQGYKVYSELNPATLSGAIDIVVVEQSTGELACSPFHVRFGKLSTLLPQEKKVEIQVNGEHIDFPMKLGDAGEAFFVFETEQEVPEEFQTSPLAGPMSDNDAEEGEPTYLDLGPPDSTDGHKEDDAGYVSAHSAHGPFESESDEETSAAAASKKAYRRSSPPDGGVPPTIGSPKIIVEEQVEETVTRHVDGYFPAVLDVAENEGMVEESAEKETVVEDTKVLMEGIIAIDLNAVPAQEAEEPKHKMATESEAMVLVADPKPESERETTHTSTEQRARVLEDGSTEVERVVTTETSSNANVMRSTTTINSETFVIRPAGGKTTSGLLEVTHLKRNEEGVSAERVEAAAADPKAAGDDHIVLDMAGYKTEGADDVRRRAESMAEARVDVFEQLQQQQQTSSVPDLGRLHTVHHHDDDDDDDTLSVKSAPLPDHDTRTPAMLPIAMPKNASTPNVAAQSEDGFDWDDNQGPFSDTEVDRGPGLERGKFSRTSPLSDTEMEYEPQSGSGKKDKAEWSWGWGALPVKKDKDGMGDVKKDREREREKEEERRREKEKEGKTTFLIEMSLCGAAEFGADENEELFKSQQLTYEAFVENPNVLNDQNLIFKYQNRYYNWALAGPLFTSLLLHPKPHDDATLIPLSSTNGSSNLAQANAAAAAAAAKAETDRRKSYSLSRSIGRLFTWSSTTSSSTEQRVGEQSEVIEKEKEGDVVGQQVETTTTTTTTTTSLGVEQLAPDEIPGTPTEAMPPSKNYAKTLRLTSDQLKRLNLKKGVNTVSFSVSSSFSRQNAICVSKIFFWDHTTQIVISDIDGTITKSDALGHLFTIVGKDWTHSGVAKLYTDIHNNGYQMLYLTSRAIGQADYTRNYMKNVNQNHYQLPDGPVIMSPDRLLTAFHREVIARKPEIFKMACLRDVQRLFDDHNPFYAGFGNRITDALSYRSVNVPISRIFTIDSNGELKLELLSGYKSSYLHLNDLVDQIFPPINKKLVEEYNDWNFWKAPLPEFDLPELPPPPKTPPPRSPPLSSSPPLPSRASISDLKLSSSKSTPSSSTSPSPAPSTGGRSRRLFFSSFDPAKEGTESPSLSTSSTMPMETTSPLQSDDEGLAAPSRRSITDDVGLEGSHAIPIRRQGGRSREVPPRPASPSSLTEEVVEAVKGMVGMVAGREVSRTPSPPAPEIGDRIEEGERSDDENYEGEDEEGDSDKYEEEGDSNKYEEEVDVIPDIDNVPYL